MFAAVILEPDLESNLANLLPTLPTPLIATCKSDNLFLSSINFLSEQADLWRYA